jgi:pyridoxamine 5'-phosphate oxidase-like protein
MDMFFLATADAEGRPNCSYKGGSPGFVRVVAREVFPNCPRYIHRMKKVEHSAFVPQDGCVTQVPEWKRAEWANDYLPAADPARDPTRPGRPRVSNRDDEKET